MNVADSFDTGVVTVSLDTELAWGNIMNSDYSEVGSRFAGTKAAARSLLELFDDYDFPSTWALVGQLFRENVDGRPGTAGVDVVPADASPPWNRDWWTAPELVRAIADSPVGHEIASHSGTHLVYTGADRSEVTEDLSLFRELASGFEPITSFVFPQNAVAHLNILNEFGFKQFRGRPPLLGSDPSPTAFLPRKQNGLVNVPASAALRHYGNRNPLLSNLPDKLKLAGLKAGVEHAARRGRVFHLVLHPSDFTLSDGEQLRSTLEAWLSYVDQRRTRGDVEVRTMAETARMCRF